jgi:hypothetical protein
MSTIRADATATVKNYVRQLRVGGHDMVEDQWRGESDAVNTVLLNNTAALAALNPGSLIMEHEVLAGSDSDITVAKAIGTLIGVAAYTATGLQDLTVTVWTPDVDQVTNPGKIALTGTSAAGFAVVTYIAA